jgi:hyaluronoglucosaminidase
MLENQVKEIGIGIVEGFFGPEWSWENRSLVVDSIRSSGANFYIYAPKRDSFLRKNWKQDHPPEQWTQLKTLRSKCKGSQVDFGIGLSPFELHTEWGKSAKDKLRDKILKLEELEFSLLGLFFDDMKGSEDLAEKQSEIVNFVKSITDRTLIFCPTYYSHDPILDKVFGKRPEGYLESLGKNIPSDVLFCWTGNKVISESILAEELEQLATTIKRKPLIWDNYFANDGPKQCKFLKLKPLKGRSKQALEASAGWAFNLMNQAQLSVLVFLASIGVLKQDLEPQVSLLSAIQKLTNSEFARNVIQSEQLFGKVGLDEIDTKARADLRRWLNSDNSFGHEILEWLDGQYIVGSECLTD